MKSYYFFVAYQVYTALGQLLSTGDSLERIDTDVDDGDFEHFGLHELREKIRSQTEKRNPLVEKGSKVIFTSINELSEELWNQLADGELISYKNKEKNNEKDDYMKLSKARLAELLAERDARDALMRGISQPIEIPTWPSCFHGGPCTNPQMDCINCPRKGYTGGIHVTTSTNGKE